MKRPNSLRPSATAYVLVVALLVVCPAQIQAEETAEKTAVEAPQKAVLVTGASTGIGRHITELFAERGIFVYAGARKEADLKALDAIDNVKSVRLDVTIQEEIDAAVELIEKEGRGLYGLVNNAGVAIAAPLIEVEESELDFLFDVNIYGPYRVTKAFSPMIIESKGRITTISSISGILSGALFGPYSMSKHAIEAYSDSLAREMQRFDVRVSVVEPGNYNSAIGTTLKKRIEKRGLKIEGSPFEPEMRAMMERVGDRSQYKEPDAVAEAVFHALFDESPKMRYMVVPNQNEAMWTIGKAMQEMLQLNQDQEFSYDREQLIEMMDRILGMMEETPSSD